MAKKRSHKKKPHPLMACAGKIEGVCEDLERFIDARPTPGFREPLTMARNDLRETVVSLKALAEQIKV